MPDQCQKCDRKRADGWLLVEGLCLECGGDAFLRRRAELRQQAQDLLDAETADDAA